MHSKDLDGDTASPIAGEGRMGRPRLSRRQAMGVLVRVCHRRRSRLGGARDPDGHTRLGCEPVGQRGQQRHRRLRRREHERRDHRHWHPEHRGLGHRYGRCERRSRHAGVGRTQHPCLPRASTSSTDAAVGAALVAEAGPGTTRRAGRPGPRVAADGSARAAGSHAASTGRGAQARTTSRGRRDRMGAPDIQPAGPVVLVRSAKRRRGTRVPRSRRCWLASAGPGDVPAVRPSPHCTGIRCARFPRRRAVVPSMSGATTSSSPPSSGQGDALSWVSAGREPLRGGRGGERAIPRRCTGGERPRACSFQVPPGRASRPSSRPWQVRVWGISATSWSPSTWPAASCCPTPSRSR